MKFEAQGRVVKGLGGLFDVRVEDEGGVRVLAVRARGSLRRTDERVMVGDRVCVTGDDAVPDDAVIERVLPRKNALIRPPMSNIDVLFIVFAPKEPAPVTETLDKLIAIAEYNGIEPVIVITKTDVDAESAARYADVYRTAGFSVFVTSAKADAGMAELKTYIDQTLTDGRVAAFAGASGVGKTTMMNALFPALSLPTAHISRKIERGRHTTRHVELYALHDSAGTGFLADTPGFSLLDFERFDFFSAEDLVGTFREFAPYIGKCRYADCAHGGEGAQDCAIARAAALGDVPASRLASARSILAVLKNKHSYGK